MAILIVLIALFLFRCSDTGTNPEKVNVVVSGFLYANSPSSENIKLTSMLSFDKDSSEIELIDDAEVVISSEGDSKKLISVSNGKYLFEEDVLIKENKTYTLEIVYNKIKTSAQTTVPQKPTISSLSDSVVSYKEGILFSVMVQQYENLPGIELNIDNESKYYHYLIVECIEPSKLPIWDSIPSEMGNDFVYFSDPTSTSSFTLTSRNIWHWGQHRIIVVRVNQEYVDAYDSKVQDLNTLNEPVSNITNGLGLFTAFNCDTTFFTVVKDTLNQRAIFRDRNH